MNSFNDHNSANDPQLSADDQRLIDALLEVGFDRNALSAVSPADNRRLDAISVMLRRLEDYPVEDASETLIHATLARIDRHEDVQAARMKFDAQIDRLDGEKRLLRIRVPDFITVAAVILIGVGVCWPMLSSIRQRSMDLACADNLRQVGYAFGQYAADNNQSLPMAMAGFGGWDRFSNVLNLSPLVNGGYCEEQHLNCPGHEHRDPAGFSSSYSYRMFPANVRPGWGTGRITVVLGDLNPIVDAAHAGRFIPPLSMSLNHGGRGQNVLVSDGSTMWLEQPIVGRSDNIWLPHGAIELHGGESPADDADVFLTQ